jgi:hypothetical protein
MCHVQRRMPDEFGGIVLLSIRHFAAVSLDKTLLVVQTREVSRKGSVCFLCNMLYGDVVPFHQIRVFPLWFCM